VCSTGHGHERSEVLVGGRQWRPRRGSGVRARKDGAGLLYLGARRLGVPCAPRPRGQGMGGGTAEYGEVWAAACNGVRANGGEAVPPSSVWQPERGPRRSVRRKWVPPRADRRALAGLACGPGGTVAARRCACAVLRATSRAWARSAQFEIRLAMFDC
jgi:hypothetical protein